MVSAIPYHAMELWKWDSGSQRGLSKQLSERHIHGTMMLLSSGLRFLICLKGKCCWWSMFSLHQPCPCYKQSWMPAFFVIACPCVRSPASATTGIVRQWRWEAGIWSLFGKIERGWSFGNESGGKCVKGCQFLLNSSFIFMAARLEFSPRIHNLFIESWTDPFQKLSQWRADKVFSRMFINYQGNPHCWVWHCFCKHGHRSDTNFSDLWCNQVSLPPMWITILFTLILSLPLSGSR